jgi:hypothetical protein
MVFKSGSDMTKTILITAFIAGTLDISAAFIQSYIMNGVMPSTVLMYIASGIFGEQAFSGGTGIMALGLLVHYLIALSCTACFFWFYPRVSFLRKSIVLNSIIIALVAWVVTTRIIIPLSRIQTGSFNLSRAFIAVLILIVCIGLPIAYNARRYFSRINR